jgi:hypothetical protein
VTSVNGRPVNIVQPNTGAGASSADTFGVVLGYFVTPHIAAELEVGIPPKFDISGTGSLDSDLAYAAGVVEKADPHAAPGLALARLRTAASEARAQNRRGRFAGPCAGNPRARRRCTRARRRGGRGA